MLSDNFTNSPIFTKLKEQSAFMSKPENHLKYLLNDQNRLKKCSIKAASIFYDFSHQRVNNDIINLLFELAKEKKLTDKFNAMAKGAKINTTENRAVLHTLTRNFKDTSVIVDGIDAYSEIQNVRFDIKTFADNIHSGKIKGSTGKPFKHIVVIGIGGSYLGTEFVSTALAAFADKNIKIHYLANVDIHNFALIATEIEPESTMWVVISKSYTTAETMANVKQVYTYMEKLGLNPKKHVVTVTSKGSPGDSKTGETLGTFHMFDFIGGRYSVTSAVGGVPLSLYLGYDKFERFLKGANEVDVHTQNAPLEKNLPLIAALIEIWNNNFLGYESQGIIPYAEPLKKLAAHIQQLYMESLGKSVTVSGKNLAVKSGSIIFGEPGTNAQHSFFQLAHQGRPFPIDFIGAINPQFDQYNNKSKGVTNYQELWSNFIAQPKALAIGKDDENPAKCFSGNRPSSTILLNDLSCESIGRLLAFYEAKAVYQGFIWDINPFDQFGVELGKKLATGIRCEMEKINNDSSYTPDEVDPISKFYIEKLFSKKL